LPDLTVIVQHCLTFARTVLDDELTNLAIAVIDKAGDDEKSTAIGFLIQGIVQSEDPSTRANSLWPYSQPCTESATALRVRVIAS
jgi:hypothetical protein